MKIGVYIGSFNPIHLVHEKIVNILLNEELDKIIIIPANEKYHLKKGLEEFKHRYNMINLVFSKNVIVSELEKDSYHYTCENIKTLKDMYENDDLYLIIGADNLIELNTWKNYKYLLENCNFIVFNRNEIDITEYIKNNFKNYENKFIIKKEIANISSTLIRKKLKYGEEVSLYLNEKVIEYIEKNNLYEVNGNEY